MSDYPDYTDVMQIIGSDIMVPFDIQGAYIMMPVDIQAQYVNVEVDIVAQTIGNIAIDIAAQTMGNIAINLAASAITLDINIASITGGVTFNVGTVSGTVNVNLAASAITLNVDITAQTIGNLAVNIAQAISLNVDITAQTIGNLTIDIEAQSVAIFDQPQWASKEGTDKNFTCSADNQAFGAYTYASYSVPGTKTLYLCGMSFVVFANLPADADLNQNGFVQLYNFTDAVYLASLGGNGGGGVTFSKPISVAANKEVRLMVYNMANHNCAIKATAWGYEL